MWLDQGIFMTPSITDRMRRESVGSVYSLAAACRQRWTLMDTHDLGENSAKHHAISNLKLWQSVKHQDIFKFGQNGPVPLHPDGAAHRNIYSRFPLQTWRWKSWYCQLGGTAVRTKKRIYRSFDLTGRIDSIGTAYLQQLAYLLYLEQRDT